MDELKKINFELPKITFEDEISKWKEFYLKYLYHFKGNRNEVLAKLQTLYQGYQIFANRKTLLSSETVKLDIEAEDFIKKQFHKDIFTNFSKIPEVKQKSLSQDVDNFWGKLGLIILESFAHISNELIATANYRFQFLKFIYDCYYNYGLHPNITKREHNIFGRYNIVIEFSENRKTEKETKPYLKKKDLEENILRAWENNIDLTINGRNIKHKNIKRIKASYTLLKIDEIPLFAQKHGFSWTNQLKDIDTFINTCPDVTDQIIKNPKLKAFDKKEELENKAEIKQIEFKNQSISYIDIDRISELKNLKNKKFDLSKLIQICEELNNAAISKSYYSVSLLGRAVIDHIPPIFKCENFAEYANNKSGKSIKASLLNLQNSLRKISDNHIHSPIQQKEITPNIKQIDFSNDLDVLLGEVIREISADNNVTT